MDVTKKPWWRWQTGMVVFVKGGCRPVSTAIVIAAGDSYRVVDQWGDLGALHDPRTGIVTPDLTAIANAGILFQMLTEELQKREPTSSTALFIDEDIFTSMILTIDREDGDCVWFHHKNSPEELRQTFYPIIAALNYLTGQQE